MSVTSRSPQNAIAVQTWRRKENLWPRIILMLLTLLAWGYTFYEMNVMGAAPSASEMGEMSMAQPANRIVDLGVFVLGWSVMMAAMMLPAALPLTLLYRTVARKGMSTGQGHLATAVLVPGYLSVWTIAGLPVYGYTLLSNHLGSLSTVLPRVLLVAGGAYQFTALKAACHSRCSNPLMFLMQHFRPGTSQALQLGVRHGVDCLGCCVGLMLGLVALGMMNLAWMLTAAVIIFAEKTLPGGHRVARPLGVLLVVAGLLSLAIPVFRSDMVM